MLSDVRGLGSRISRLDPERERLAIGALDGRRGFGLLRRRRRRQAPRSDGIHVERRVHGDTHEPGQLRARAVALVLAWISSVRCWETRDSTVSTSLGGRNPASNRARTSASCASMRRTDSSTTETASVAVTRAQKARVVSSRRSARGRFELLAGRLLFGRRRAFQRLRAAAGVDRPLHVEPRAPVVRDVRIQHLDPAELHAP